MVLVDNLCEAKEMALNSVNPHLFTIATLTGHVIRAYGEDYTVSKCLAVLSKVKKYYLKCVKHKKGNISQWTGRSIKVTRSY